MTLDDLGPDAFARLMALPEDHPDRHRAASAPGFEARRRLYEQFAAREQDLMSAAELSSAEHELGRRLERAIGATQSTAPHGGGAPSTLAPSAPGAPRPGTLDRGDRGDRGHGWLTSLREFWRQPAPRAAWSLAAAVLLVATATWIVMRRPARETLRSAPPTEQLVIGEPRLQDQSLELSWTAVPGADAYRLVFFGSDLTEIASVNDLVAPAYVLERSALPSGLAPAQEVMTQVIAMRTGEPLAKSRPRSIRVP